MAEILNTLRPAMEADGGGIDYFVIENETVKIRLKAASLASPSINLTMKLGLTQTLLNKTNWVKSLERIL